MTKDRLPAETDIVTKLSSHSVRETVARFTGIVNAKGLKIFGVIDQADEA